MTPLVSAFLFQRLVRPETGFRTNVGVETRNVFYGLLDGRGPSPSKTPPAYLPLFFTTTTRPTFVNPFVKSPVRLLKHFFLFIIFILPWYCLRIKKKNILPYLTFLL